MTSSQLELSIDYDPKKVIVLESPILKKSFPSDKYNYGGVKILETKPGFNYPGRSKPKETCRLFYPYSCQCGRTKQIIHHSCHRVICPVCYQSAIKRESTRITERFDEIRILLQSQLGITMKLSHITFNIHQELTIPYLTKVRKIPKVKVIKTEINTIKDYKKVKSALLKILNEQGLSGILVFHAWRRKRHPITQKIVGMYWSPHFHFLGVGFVESSKVFKKKYGFTYKKIRNVYSNKQIYIVARYMLSHSPKIPHQHQVIWTNQFSYNKFKTTKRERTDIITCEYCDGPLFQIIESYLKIEGNFYDNLIFYFPADYHLDYEKVLKKKEEKIYLTIKDPAKFRETLYRNLE